MMEMPKYPMVNEHWAKLDFDEIELYSYNRGEKHEQRMAQIAGQKGHESDLMREPILTKRRGSSFNF